MKKLFSSLMALTMLIPLSACGKKADETSESSQTEETTAADTTAAEETTEAETTTDADTPDLSGVPEGSVTDETKLGESITYKTDSEGYIIFSIKTSADIKMDNGWLGLCPLGIYLTEESADAVDSYYEYVDTSYDKEWFDGAYTFKLNNDCIAADTYTMVLCDDDDCGNIIGEWIFKKDESGKFEVVFDDAWLIGAGEKKETKEFDSLEDEVASWFDFNAYSEDWSEFFFDGYYLEETDPQGYDCYYMMICPEGDYSTYDDADAVDLTYAGIGEKCPYKFSLDNYCVPELGKYTIVLAKMGGDVEIQFNAEKVSATDWKMDFSDAKCPALESKYAETSTDTETTTAVEEETTEEAAS